MTAVKSSSHSHFTPWLSPVAVIVLGLFACSVQAQESATNTSGEAVLDEVVVTSTPTKKPNIAKINPKAPIQPLPAPDGASLLKTVPNMTVIRKGGIDGDPLFRGLGGSRLAITADDHHLFGGCGGRMDPPTAYIYPENYDEVIITKGPQSVTQGPGLITGSVQFVRDTPKFTQPGLNFDGSFTAGSAGRLDAFGGLTAGWKYGYARLNLVNNEADNYSDGNGKEVHSAYSRNSQNLQVGITPDEKTLIEASYDRSRGHAAYADRMMDGIKFDRDAWNVKASRRDITPWLSELKAQYGHSYVDHLMDNYTLRTVKGMKMANNPDRETDTARLEGTLSFDKVKAQIGVDWMDDQHTLRTGSGMDAASATKMYLSKPRMPDQHFRNLGVYAEGTWLLDEKNRLVAGYRHDNTDAQYQSGYANYATVKGTQWEDQTYRLNSGFLRYERRDNNWTYYAGLGVAQRAPDFWERMRSFKLSKETNKELDVGVMYQRDNLSASLSLFGSRIDDFILVDTNTTPQARNIDARRWGGEAEVMWHFAPSWKIGQSIAYTRGKNTTDGLPLAQTPPLESKTTLGYDNGKFSAALLFRAVAAQNRIAPGQGNIVGQDLKTGSKGFGVVSLNASWKMNKNMTVSAGVDNLFDKVYSEPINKSAYDLAALTSTGVRINEPGRQFWLKLNAKF